MLALAYPRQSPSSKRNWSKFLPEPGSTSWLGPLGTVTHPASASAARSGRQRGLKVIFVLPGSARRGLRRDPLPAAGALLDVRVVGLRVGAPVPEALRVLRGVALLDVGRGRLRHG